MRKILPSVATVLFGFLIFAPATGGEPLGLYKGLKAKYKGQHVYYHDLIPLGWSQDGDSWAVLIRSEDGNTGFRAALTIINLATDGAEVVRSWRWEDGGARSPVFSEALQQSSAELKKRNFVSAPAPKVERFGRADGLSLQVEFLRSKSLRVTLQQGEKKKAVRNDDLSKEHEFDQTVGVELHGFVRSPNQARIAILLIRTGRRFEGEVFREALVTGARIGSKF